MMNAYASCTAAKIVFAENNLEPTTSSADAPILPTTPLRNRYARGGLSASASTGLSEVITLA